MSKKNLGFLCRNTHCNLDLGKNGYVPIISYEIHQNIQHRQQSYCTSVQFKIYDFLSDITLDFGAGHDVTPDFSLKTNMDASVIHYKKKSKANCQVPNVLSSFTGDLQQI